MRGGGSGLLPPRAVLARAEAVQLETRRNLAATSCSDPIDRVAMVGCHLRAGDDPGDYCVVRARQRPEPRYSHFELTQFRYFKRLGNLPSNIVGACVEPFERKGEFLAPLTLPVDVGLIAQVERDNRWFRLLFTGGGDAGERVDDAQPHDARGVGGRSRSDAVDNGEIRSGDVGVQLPWIDTQRVTGSIT